MSNPKQTWKCFLKVLSLNVRKERAQNIFAVKRYKGTSLSSEWIRIRAIYPFKCDSIVKFLRKLKFEAAEELKNKHFILLAKSLNNHKCRFIWSKDDMGNLLDLKLKNSKFLATFHKKIDQKEFKVSLIEKNLGKVLKYSNKVSYIGLVLQKEYLTQISEVLKKSLKRNRFIQSFALKSGFEILVEPQLKQISRVIDPKKVKVLQLSTTEWAFISPLEISLALRQFQSVEHFDLSTRNAKKAGLEVEHIFKSLSCPQTLQELRYDTNYVYSPGKIFKDFFERHKKIRTISFNFFSSGITNSDLLSLQMEINKLPDLKKYWLICSFCKDVNSTKVSPLLESFSGMRNIESLKIFFGQYLIIDLDTTHPLNVFEASLSYLNSNIYFYAFLTVKVGLKIFPTTPLMHFQS